MLDQEQFLTQNQILIQEWFDLYQYIKAQHSILDKDIYNMNENSYMIGIAGSFKLIFSKSQK